MTEGRKLTVTVHSSSSRSSSIDNYISTVDSGITCGEFIRNCCVNVGIDPDTHEGFTRNIRVFAYACMTELGEKQSSKEGEHKEGTLWMYNPVASLEDSPLVAVPRIRIEEIMVAGTNQANLFLPNMI